jgi:hypothetical protein
MDSLSEITKLIISNFNKPVDEIEAEERIETEIKYLQLYVDLIRPTLDYTGCATNVKIDDINFAAEPGVNNIKDVCFIDDVVFVLKIVEFRRLEIRKQLMNVKYSLEMFYYLVVSILALQSKHASGQIVHENDIVKLKANKDIVKRILVDLSQIKDNNNGQFWINKLDKYNCLDTIFTQLSIK